MRGLPRQRGSLMIVAIVMIMVLGFMGVAITFLSVTSTYNAVDELAASETFILAESGLERGIREWSLAPSTYTGEGPVSFGKGTFTITVALLSATQANITSSAAIPTISGNTTRTVDTIVELGGPLFSDPLTDMASWPTEELDFTQGTASIVAGGLRFRTANLKDAVYAGYRETGTAPPLITLNEGESFNLDLDYKKRWAGNGAIPTSMDMAVELVSTTGTNYVIWSENTLFSNNNWITAPTTTWTVPAGVTINRIRLSFNLARNGNGRRPSVFFRTIVFTSSSGSGTSTISWQEIIP